MYVIGGLLILAGITKFRFSSRKAQNLIRYIGETGTQIFYIVLGIALILLNMYLP
jgi:hypothetical protein